MVTLVGLLSFNNRLYTGAHNMTKRLEAGIYHALEKTILLDCLFKLNLQCPCSL